MRRTILMALTMFSLSTPAMAQVGGAGGSLPAVVGDGSNAQSPAQAKTKAPKPAPRSVKKVPPAQVKQTPRPDSTH